jgi:hypothetical protein
MFRIPNINTTKSAPKTNIHNRRPAPYNKLTAEIQYFQPDYTHHRALVLGLKSLAKGTMSLNVSQQRRR